MPESYSASAPGSLILMGDYSVLKNYPAIVGAIDKRITVTLTPRLDRQLFIESSLGRVKTSLDLPIKAPLDYVLTALNSGTTGYNVQIESEFTHTLGLGSSAAVTVATVAALSRAEKQPLCEEAIFEAAMQVVRQVQGSGSGADVAASLLGGVVEYRVYPLKMRRTTVIPPIVVVFSGAKTTTKVALKKLKARETHEAIKFYIDRLGALSKAALTPLELQDWPHLGRLMTSAQQELVNLGVSTESIDTIVTALSKEPNLYGAKISGSGLGDCVIALGEASNNINALPVKLSNTGLKYDD